MEHSETRKRQVELKNMISKMKIFTEKFEGS